MENPFTAEFQSFLIERIHNLDFSAVSPPFRKTAHEITTSLPSDDSNHRLTTNTPSVPIPHANQFTIAIEIAYQKGFAEGVKLILYLFNP